MYSSQHSESWPHMPDPLDNNFYLSEAFIDSASDICTLATLQLVADLLHSDNEEPWRAVMDVMAPNWEKLSDKEREVLEEFAELLAVAHDSFLKSIIKQEHLLKEAPVPVTHTNDADAFFDRKLIQPLLAECVACDPVQTPTIKQNGDIDVTLRIHPEDLDLACDLMTEAAKAPFEAGAYIIGWKYAFEDGAVAAIMLMNGDTAGKPYIDAVLVPPMDEYRDVPNISLEPRRVFVGEYVFDYPNDTKRTIRIAKN